MGYFVKNVTVDVIFYNTGEEGKMTAVLKSFDEQLTEVSGKVRHINMWNQFDRFHDGLLYYWNNAEKLNKSATVLWAAAQDDVALMLAGHSIELLLKGTILGLQEVFPHCHRLECLISTAGISISDTEHVTSQLLTEYIVWAARYPTPRKAEDWFLEETGGWPLSLAPKRYNATYWTDYENLWNTLTPYFWQVKDATYESADLSENEFIRPRKGPQPKHECESRRV
jgi:hypothetical protein